jgi:hypothetical protein
VAAACADADGRVKRIVVVRQFVPRGGVGRVVPRLLEEAEGVDGIFRTGSEAECGVGENAGRRHTASLTDGIIRTHRRWAEAKSPSGQKSEDACKSHLLGLDEIRKST